MSEQMWAPMSFWYRGMLSREAKYEISMGVIGHTYTNIWNLILYNVSFLLESGHSSAKRFIQVSVCLFSTNTQ